MSFATQSVMGMLLTLVVWDRSELFLLRHLSSDIRQLSFYSVAFNLAERLLIFPTIFAAATGASILAQYGRDRTKLPSMTAASARYIAMISIPLHIIAVPLAAPVLLVLYGKQYIGALVVATAAPILCLPKAFLGPIQSLFESVDRQKYFLVTTVIASFVDIAVAWYLIPAHGALGACLGSGAAQITAVGLMWGIGIRKYRIQLPWVFLMKLAAVSLVSSLGAYTAVSRLSPLWGLIAGSVIATSIFFLLCYVFKMLEPEDRDRFKVISNALPRAIGTPMNYLLDHFTRHLTPKSTAV
jgi:O-antigen/teichoic acid export membrane protein